MDNLLIALAQWLHPDECLVYMVRPKISDEIFLNFMDYDQLQKKQQMEKRRCEENSKLLERSNSLPIRTEFMKNTQVYNQVMTARKKASIYDELKKSCVRINKMVEEEFFLDGSDVWEPEFIKDKLNEITDFIPFKRAQVTDKAYKLSSNINEMSLKELDILLKEFRDSGSQTDIKSCVDSITQTDLIPTISIEGLQMENRKLKREVDVLFNESKRLLTINEQLRKALNQKMASKVLSTPEVSSRVLEQCKEIAREQSRAIDDPFGDYDDEEEPESDDSKGGDDGYDS